MNSFVIKHLQQSFSIGYLHCIFVENSNSPFKLGINYKCHFSCLHEMFFFNLKCKKYKML